MSVPSFDYLRAIPTWEEVLFSWRVPKILQGACRALCCSVLFASTAWFFEGARLHTAIHNELLNANRYARQLNALRAERLQEKRVRILTDLDGRVRAIAKSGTLAARRLAALSTDLPENVWITALTPDADGVLLDGRTRNLKGLSDTFLRLNADPLFRRPSLLSAQATAAVAPLGLRFSIHVAQAVP